MSELIGCPKCGQRLLAPANKALAVCCPQCGHTWVLTSIGPGPFHIDDVEVSEETFNRYWAGVVSERAPLKLHELGAEERLRELEEANRELKRQNELLTLVDALTGLPNRRATDDAAVRELKRRVRRPRPLAMGLIDVDHFKEINARCSLAGGDKVLVDLAKALASVVRATDYLGRVGGEEFLIIAPETGRRGADALGRRIYATVANTQFIYDRSVIPVRVSVGFAVAGRDELPDYNDMKRRAAAALAEAKRRRP
jgi:diguanylate cyclase